VHSGLYYRPGSLKARTCIRGQTLLWDWAQRHEVPHHVTGKLVVARGTAEREALGRLYENAMICGAAEVKLISGAAVRGLEGELPAVDEALHCSGTGVVDPVAFARSLRIAAEDAGATVIFRAEVHSVGVGPPHELVTSRGDVRAHALVNAGGIHGDVLARTLLPDAPQHHACRGDYFRLRTAVSYRHLIYPVRIPGDAGLGIHLTLELDGRARLGPDVEWTHERQDHTSREEKLPAFLEAGRRLLGSLEATDLVWDGCGIRPKLRAPHEDEDHDFLLLDGPPGCLHLLGIESPGLTSAMALAEEVRMRLGAA
jgi:L-2-hydroxyglutarate oxidase LhgO